MRVVYLTLGLFVLLGLFEVCHIPPLPDPGCSRLATGLVSCKPATTGHLY